MTMLEILTSYQMVKVYMSLGSIAAFCFAVILFITREKQP